MEQQATTTAPSVYSETQSPTLTPTNKICNHCGRVLPFEAFHRCARNKDGHQTYCKDCQNEINREHKKKERAKMAEGCNPELAKFKPVQPIEELRARGYKGTLTYTYEIAL